jgi:hypothetical protein
MAFNFIYGTDYNLLKNKVYESIEVTVIYAVNERQI